MPDNNDVIYHLDLLRKDLEAAGLAARLVTGDNGRPPFVRVVGSTSHMSEQITIKNDYFWWSWDEPVLPVTDRVRTVQRIAYVLTPGTYQ